MSQESHSAVVHPRLYSKHAFSVLQGYNLSKDVGAAFSLLWLSWSGISAASAHDDVWDLFFNCFNFYSILMLLSHKHARRAVIGMFF